MVKKIKRRYAEVRYTLAGTTESGTVIGILGKPKRIAAQSGGFMVLRRARLGKDDTVRNRIFIPLQAVQCIIDLGIREEEIDVPEKK